MKTSARRLNFALSINETTIKHTFPIFFGFLKSLTFCFGFLLFANSSNAQFQYQQKIVAPDRAFGDNFGIYTIDVQDSTMATGSFWNDLDEFGLNSVTNAGAAYIYNLSNTGNWVFNQKLVPNSRLQEDNFGRTVLLHNDFVFIASTGADFDSTGNNLKSSAGLVYVFKKNTSGNYIQTQVLQGIHRNNTALFGTAMAAQNNTLFIGSIGDSADATNSTFAVSAGSVNIFTFNSSTNYWEFSEKLVAFDRDGSDQFGYNIAIENNTLAIAAITDEHDSSGVFVGGGKGSIYVYNNNGSNWILEDKISALDGSSNDGLGESLALEGNYIAAGATGTDTDSAGANGITNNGAVYTFKRNINGNWIQTDKVTEPIRQASDFFGYFVSLKNEVLVVSAFNEDEDENGVNTVAAAGALYVYKKQNNENWKFDQKLVEANRNIADQMGRGLAFENGYILTSAPGEKLDTNEQNSISSAGAIFTFYDSSLAPAPILPPDTILSINENTTSDTIIDLTLLAGDSTYTYEFTSGDSSNFKITSNYLAVDSLAALDAESTTLYNLTIAYSNGVDSGLFNIDVNILDLVEKITFGFQSGYSIRYKPINETKTNLPLGNSARSVQAWFKKEVNALNPQAIVNYGTWIAGEPEKVTSLTIQNSGYVNFLGKSIPTVRVDDNQWHHVVGTYDGTNVKVFLDGIEYVNSPATFNTVGNSFTIGRNVAGGFENFEGNVDEIAIWDRVLSAEEVLELGYRSASKNDPSLKVYYDFDIYRLNSSNFQTLEQVSGSFENISNGNFSSIIEGPGTVTNPISLEFNQTFLLGDRIGQIQAFDLDGSSVSYNLISGGNGALSVNSATGEIEIANTDSLSNLSNSSYILSIEATEAGDNTSDTLNIIAYLNSYLGPVTLPYFESFETTGGFLNLSGDTKNWKLGTGSTTNFYAGPSSAYRGANYLYLEEESSGDSAVMELPYFDISNDTALYLHFKFHSYSSLVTVESNYAKLYVRADTNNSGNWETIFDTSGNFYDQWNNVNIELDKFDDADLLRIQFIQVHPGNNSEIAIDDLHLTGSNTYDVYAKNLIDVSCYLKDSLNFKGLVQVKSTLPTVSLTATILNGITVLGNVSQTFTKTKFNEEFEIDFGNILKATYSNLRFIVRETNNPDTLSYNDTARFFFSYPEAELTAFESFLDTINLEFDIPDTSKNWLVSILGANQNLSKVLDNSGVISFGGVTQNSWYNFKLIEICGTDTLYSLIDTNIFSACDYVTLPYIESFENTTCFEIEENGNLNFGWKLFDGNLGSSPTGPDFSQSGSNHLFFESSSGNEGESNTFYSPYIDLRNQQDIDFTFFHHMYGIDINKLEIDIDTSNQNIWLPLFSDSAEKGNFWIYNNISLNNYLGNDSVRIRFVGYKGASFRGDIGIDNIQIKQKDSTDVAALSLIEGDCFMDTLNSFIMSAKNNGLSTLTNYSAQLFDPNNLLLSTVSDSNISIAVDSVFSIEFQNIDNKISGQYRAEITAFGDTNSFNEETVFNYSLSLPTFYSISGANPLLVTYSFNGLNQNHQWLATIADNGINKSVFLDSNLTASINGLEGLTQYSIDLYEVCQTDTFYVSTGNVTTECGLQPLPFFQSFETFNECFSTENTPVNDANWYRTTFFSNLIYPTDGNAYMRGSTFGAGDTGFIYLTPINLKTESNPKLYFDYFIETSLGAQIIVQADTAGIGQWSTLLTINSTSKTDWQDTALSLNNVNGDSTIIRFLAISGATNNSYAMGLDNVSVYGDQLVDYNFIELKTHENCAYKDSLETELVFTNSGLNTINGFQYYQKIGTRGVTELINTGDTVLSGDTLVISLGRIKYGTQVIAFYNDLADIITNNNSISQTVENEISVSTTLSNDSATLVFEFAENSANEFILGYGKTSPKNFTDFIEEGIDTIQFQKNDTVYISNLTPGYSYLYQVKEVCNSKPGTLLNYDVVNEDEFKFKMPCADTLAIGYFEDFELFPNCFNNSQFSNHADWFGSQQFFSTYGPQELQNSTYYHRASGSFGGDSNVTVSPYFDLTTNQTPIVSFNYSMYGPQITGFVVQIDTGGEWNTIFSKNGDQGASWKQQILRLPNYRNKTARFRFINTGSQSSLYYQNIVGLDNFLVDTVDNLQVFKNENISPNTEFFNLSNLSIIAFDSVYIQNSTYSKFFDIDADNNLIASSSANFNFEKVSQIHLDIVYESTTLNDTLGIDLEIENVIENLYAGLGSAIKIETNDQFSLNGKILPDGANQTFSFWMKNKNQPLYPQMINFGRFILDYSFTDAQFNGIFPGPISDTGWVHIAQVFDGSNTYLFLNGVAVDTGIASNNSYSTNFIGNPSGSQNTGDGFRFDEISLWKKPLTTIEIKDLMSGVKNPNDTNLVAYYNMDYQENTTQLSDLSGNEYHLNAVVATYGKFVNAIDTVPIYIVDTTNIQATLTNKFLYDPDSNKVEILSFNGGGYFQLNSDSSEIVLSSPLNFSIQNSILVSLTAIESGDNSFAFTTFQVLVNAFPNYPDTAFNLVENPLEFDTVFTNNVFYSNTDRTFTYYISDSTANAIFYSDSSNGIISIKSPSFFDAEVLDTFNFFMYAFDNQGFFDSSLVRVIIIDTIEPIFVGFENAVQLNGVDEYLESNNAVLPATGDFSVSVWAKQNSLQSSAFNILSQNSTFSASNKRFYLGASNTGEIKIGDDWVNTGVQFPSDLMWHNYTVVRAASDIKLFIDGDSVASNIINYANPDLPTFKIGVQFSGISEFFDGQVDELKIWNTTLNPNDVKKYLVDAPSDLDSTMILYYDFNATNDSVSDLSVNNQNALFVNFANPNNAYLKSNDTLPVFISELISDTNTLFTTKAEDSDNSQLFFEIIAASDSLFTINDSTGEVFLLIDTSLNFEISETHFITIKVTEQGDSQSDSVTYLIKVIDEAEPINTDLEITFSGTYGGGYEFVPFEQKITNIYSTIKNNGPDSVFNFFLVLDNGLNLDSISIDTILPNEFKELSFQVSTTGLQNGAYSYASYIVTDTFDLVPVNDTFSFNLSVNDSVLAKSIVEDTADSDIYFEVKQNTPSIPTNKNLGIKFNLNKGDTLTDVGFNLKGLTLLDTFNIKLYTIVNGLPDSVLETQNVSFSDTSDGFKFINFNCFNFLDSGSYALSIAKDSIGSSNARIVTSSTYFDSTALFIFNNLMVFDTLNSKEFASMPLFQFKFSGSYNYPNLIVGSDSITCRGNIKELGLENGIDSVLWNFTTFNQIYSIDSIGIVHADYQDANGCFFDDEVYINLLKESAFNYTSDTIIGCADSLSLMAKSTWDNYLWQNTGSTDSSTKIYTPQLGLNFYSLLVSDSTGCFNQDSIGVDVKSLPNLTFNVLGPFCDNENDVIIDTALYSPLGGSFSSLIPLSGDTILISQIIGGQIDSITYSFTDTNGCFNSIKQAVEIKVAPTASLNFDLVNLDSICGNEILTNLAGGLPTYGVYKGSGVNSGSSFNADSAVIGINQITFVADSTNGCSDSSTASITVLSPPSIDSLLLDPICLNESIVSLNGGFPSGGFYTGNGVSNNQFDPLIAGSGFSNITYLLQDAFGCTDSLINSIEVYSLPLVNFAVLPLLCNNDTALNLTPYVNDTSNTYSFAGTGITGDFFNPIIVSPDTVNLIYTVTNSNSCIKSDTSSVIVLAPPVITLSTPPAICDYDTLNLLSSVNPFPIGGFFKGDFVSDSLFKADSANTYNLRYVFADSTLSKTCSDSSTFSVLVNKTENVTLNLSQLRICEDVSNILISGGLPTGTGGVYSGSFTNKISNQYFFYPPSANIGLHEIKYTFTTSAGCVDQAVDTILVDSLPQVIINTIPNICVGDDSLTIDSFGFPLGGIFSGNAVYNDSVNYFFLPDSASVGASNLIDYTYTDSITGCTNSDNYLITINQKPALNFASLPNFCERDPEFQITQFSPAGGFFTGAGITDTNNLYFFNPDSAGVGLKTITYNYTNANGCSNTLQRSTNVNPLPNVNLQLLGTPIDTLCLVSTSQSYQLTYGTPSGGQYSGKNVSFNNFNLGNVNAGTDTVFYTYSDPVSGCTSSDTSYLEIVNLPNVSFILNDDSICNNADTLILTGGNSTSILAQSVYSGPGVSNGIFYPTQITPGIYNLNFSVSDTNGCSDSASASITVHPKPSLSFNAIAPICLNDTAIINANISGALTWNFKILTATTNTITPTTGLFESYQTSVDSIQFRLTDANSCSDSAVQAITVDTLPLVNVANFNDVCRNGNPINLNTGTPIGGTYFYKGSAVTGSLSPSTLGVGTHQILYTFTDQNGCFSSDSNNIDVNAAPSITLSNYPKVCTDGNAITLNQGSPVGGIYTASQGMLNDSVFDPTVVLAGNYSINYNFVDTNGCDSSLAGILLVNPLPVVNFKNLIPSLCTNSDSVFIGDSVNFPALPPRGYFTGKGIDSLGWFDPYVAWIGGHNISYNYTDTNGCQNSTTTSIIVNGLPTPIILQNEVQICLGDTAILEAQGGVEFLWETGDTSSIIRVSPDSFKTYSVTITDGLSCSNFGSIDQDVYNSFFVKALKDSVTTNFNTAIIFDLLANDNGNITRYSILDGPYNGTIDETFNPDLEYTPNTGFRRVDSLTYELCDDFCPTVCDTGKVSIQVYGNPNEFIPNGFSPNSDGMNDTWVVPGIEQFPNNELIIFNRWGDVVYQAAPYTNDWAGESGGILSIGSDRLPDGTYFYILKLDKSDSSDGLTGTIEMRSKL